MQKETINGYVYSISQSIDGTYYGSIQKPGDDCAYSFQNLSEEPSDEKLENFCEKKRAVDIALKEAMQAANDLI